jgi:hypothetical protein
MFDVFYYPHAPSDSFKPFTGRFYDEVLKDYETLAAGLMNTLNDNAILSIKCESLMVEIYWQIQPDFPVFSNYQTWQVDNSKTRTGPIDKSRFPTHSPEFKPEYLVDEFVKTDFLVFQRRFMGDPRLFKVRVDHNSNDIVNNSFPVAWVEDNIMCIGLGDFHTPLSSFSGDEATHQLHMRQHSTADKLKSELAGLESNLMRGLHASLCRKRV